jgi:HAD superfamily hydrolase (TIGR01509 family)
MFRDLYDTEMTPEDFTAYIGAGPIRYTEGPAEKYGITIDLEKAVACRQEKFIDLLEGGMDISFPGVLTLVNALLDDNDWRVALATSSSREKSRHALGAAGVPFEGFGAYLTGDDVTQKKPAPDIYLKAAEGIGLPPSVCVGIEDSVNGVKAVKAAGMACIAVTNSFTREDLAVADRIVDSMEEIDLDALSTLLKAAV